ncbi:hypothetical protein K9O30_01760 [Clostridium bowmanii]|uniref:hypothetical protein n=1 Tax=Clostridium bowmanii TaxID=132925 RepID=UPI001C0E13D1|nr:hypothetical protein [Clostridium bowmanii]MBU3190304.1 hypothetical protein [Clostridium bowmanii]MCA1072484.1 hypothetical protein [Clostridium bowmanii]
MTRFQVYKYWNIFGWLSAINATEVKVVFNSSVDATTAQNETNYGITPVAGSPLTIDAAELNADGKTVILTLNNSTALTSTATNYVVTANTNILDANGKALAKAYEGLVSLVDAVRPTIATPELKDASTVKLTFSEKVNLANGTAALAAIKVYNDKDVLTTLTNAEYIVSLDKKSVTINVGSLTKAKTYKIVTTSLVDFAGNLVTPNPTVQSFTLAADAVAPTVVAMTPINLSQMKVEFSEALKDSTSGPALGKYFKVKIDGGLAAYVVTANVTTLDNKTFIVNMKALNTNTDLTVGLHTITVSDFQDVTGNPTTPADSTKTSMLTFAATNPSLTSTVGQLKNIGGTNYVVFPVDKAVTITAGSTLTLNYIDADGVEQSDVTVTDVTNANLKALDLNNDTVTDAIGINADDVDGNAAGLQALLPGTYTAKIGSIVADTAATPNSLKDTNVSFEIKATTAETTVTTVNPNTVDPNVIVVDFDNSLDRVTALNVNNYKVDGKVIASKAVFTGDDTHVKLTLLPAIIQYNGAYQIQISGIKDIDGNAVKVFDQAVAGLLENVTPIAAAEVTAPNQITVKFNESTYGGAAETFNATDDLEVKVNGTVVTVGAPSIVTQGKTFTVAPVTGNFIVKDTDVVTITIKKGTTEVVDANGNSAVGQTITATIIK